MGAARCLHLLFVLFEQFSQVFEVSEIAPRKLPYVERSLTAVELRIISLSMHWTERFYENAHTDRFHYFHKALELGVPFRGERPIESG